MSICVTATKSAESVMYSPATPTKLRIRKTTAWIRFRTATTMSAAPTVIADSSQKATTVPVSSITCPPPPRRLRAPHSALGTRHSALSRRPSERRRRLPVVDGAHLLRKRRAVGHSLLAQLPQEPRPAADEDPCQREVDHCKQREGFSRRQLSFLPQQHFAANHHHVHQRQWQQELPCKGHQLIDAQPRERPPRPDVEEEDAVQFREEDEPARHPLLHPPERPAAHVQRHNHGCNRESGQILGLVEEPELDPAVLRVIAGHDLRLRFRDIGRRAIHLDRSRNHVTQKA